ncbi:MAG: outer membrane protein assembly factor BamE [Stellaceae bacterium]
MTIARFCSLFAPIAAVAIAGCAPSVEQRGNLPPPDAVAEIHPGKTTKDEVVKILGTPSSVGIFDDKSWYYISKRTKQVAFFLPDTTDQQVFVVDFDKNGVVSAVDHKGLKDAEVITPAPGATPAPGRELTFLEQILGNLGRFNGGGGSPASTGSGGGGGEGQPGPSPHDDR